MIEGKHAGTDARSTTQGIKADTMSEEHNAIGSDLESITAATVSASATAFASTVSLSLAGLDPNKIEQDIAIKWISGLSPDQRDEIDTASSYLKQIGVIDSKGNRLGYDTGNWTLEGDEVIVHLRAQVEQMAISAQGTTGEWMGVRVVGQVRDSNGVCWPARSTEPIPDTGGGAVTMVSYTFEGTQHVGDGFSRQGSEMDIKSKFVQSCTWTVTPLGPMGGGVYDGPTVRPG